MDFDLRKKFRSLALICEKVFLYDFSGFWLEKIFDLSSYFHLGDIGFVDERVSWALIFSGDLARCTPGFSENFYDDGSPIARARLIRRSVLQFCSRIPTTDLCQSNG